MTSGKIVEVTVDYAGTTTAGDHASGATVLSVADVLDFDEDGGRLAIDYDDGQVEYDYTSVDEDALTVTLAGPLTDPVDDDTPLLLIPLAPEVTASVALGIETGDVIEGVIVPHALLPLLAEGIREPDAAESVTLESLGSGEWAIKDVIGRPAVIDTTIRLPHSTEPYDMVLEDGAIAFLERDSGVIRSVIGLLDMGLELGSGGSYMWLDEAVSLLRGNAALTITAGNDLYLGSGRVWNLTGWNIGAHANSHGNPRYVGVLLVIGNNEAPSQAMIDSIRVFRSENLLKRYPKATAVLGHQQVPGNSTACPGKPVMALIRAGEFTKAPKPEPTPTPAPGVDKRWLKVALVNHAAATPALKRVGAKAKWLTRRRRLFDLVASVNADVISGLECGGGGTWDHIQKAYVNRGYVLSHAVKGRAIWLRKGNHAIERGHFNPPQRTKETTSWKPAPWIIAPFDGANALIVLSHLETHSDSDHLRVEQMEFIIQESEKVAAKHGLGKSQIVFMSDTASNNWVREALESHGYGDVLKEADKIVNQQWKSYNEFKPPRIGPRVDLIAVRHDGDPGPDGRRPVRVASQRTTTLTDHHIHAAVIERQ